MTVYSQSQSYCPNTKKNDDICVNSISTYKSISFSFFHFCIESLAVNMKVLIIISIAIATTAIPLGIVIPYYYYSASSTIALK